jgi:26S proteasome regulatory subunit T5
MSSAPPPVEPPSSEKPLISVDVQENARSNSDAMEVTPEPPAETWGDLPPELLSASAEEINSRMRLIDNEIRVGWFASRCRAVGGVTDAYAFAGNAL